MTLPRRFGPLPIAQQRHVLTFAAPSALAVGFVALCYVTNWSEQSIIGIVAGIVGLVVPFLAVVAEWRYSGGRLGATLFLWLGYAYFFGISAIYNSITGQLEEFAPWQLWLGIAGMLVGAVATVAGITFSRRVKLASRIPPLAPRIPKAYAYLALGTFVAISTMVRYLMYPGQFLVGGSLSDLPRSYGNYIQDLRHTHTVSGLLAVHILFSYPLRRVEKGVLCGVIALMAMFCFFEFSRRPFVLLVVASLIYLTLVPNKPRLFQGSRLLLSLVGIGSALTVVAFIGAGLRFVTFQLGLEQFSIADIIDAMTQLGLIGMSQDSFKVYIACFRWFQDPGSWILGSSFVQAFGNPIPRALWPSKPESFGFTIAQLMSDYTTNFGPTYLGEGYANGGLFGLLLFGVIFGLAAATLDAYRDANRSNRSVLLVFSLLAFEAFPQVRGDLQGMTTPMIERTAILSSIFIIWTLLVSRWPVFATATAAASSEDDGTGP